ncbi:RNA polymerase factor sigma-54 [bacterium]|nr:RNA polymerase factor sigma-54 [bacterium]MBU1781747.1 RNA polymerase factor sigma-54 [bacterium]MBU2600424.1 RNA polymerase factor sigma-54 [bacterium]
MLRQDINIQQRQILIPQLQQSLKILQLSNVELIEEIKNEVLENPFLEEVEVSPLERLEDLKKERDLEKVIHDLEEEAAISGTLKNPDNIVRESQGIEWLASEEDTLYHYLLHQLQLLSLSEKEFLIGRLLLERITPNGYLEGDLESIAEIVKEEVKAVEEVLQKIQNFEPPGIGARNLEENLLIQANYLGILDQNLEQIIKSYLLSIQKGEYKKIALGLNISQERVLDYISQIKTLEPKPTRLYGRANPLYLVPDVIITKQDSSYLIELYNDWLPPLQISSYYTFLLKKEDIQKEIRSYLIERLKKAKWFLRSIDQRQQTILAIAEAIFSYQREFLEDGPDKLKALKMESIANSLGVHLSTVSRAVANKYLQTPLGFFSFKYFFAGGKENASGEKVSKVGIKEILKKIIDQEEKDAPLKDEEIIGKLKEQGFKLARRTIAKYREELGVLPSNLRKKRSG